MIAATLRQTAAAEAIEKKAIHIMPSSIAGSVEFHRVPSGSMAFLDGKPLTTPGLIGGS